MNERMHVIMGIRCASALILSTAFFLTFSVAAENWPRFLGPNGQGTSSEEGIPAQWTGDDVSWTVDLAGKGHSSPIVWDDIVYVTYADDATGECTLIALSAIDGKALWQKSRAMTPMPMHNLNSMAASTPAADEEGVYALWYGKGKTVATAMDHQGTLRWEKNFSAVRNKHGASASPVVYRDMVIFAAEQEDNDGGAQSYWYALDRSTGDVRWRRGRNISVKPSSMTPCLYPSKQGKDLLVFASFAHGITAVDIETGEIAWEQSGVMSHRVVSSPILSEDIILGTCGGGGTGVRLVAVQAPSESASNVRTQYMINDERMVPYVPTGVVFDGRVYLLNDRGVITCLDLATGDVVWSERTRNRFFASPVLVDGKLYCATLDGEVIVIRAGETYEVLGANKLGEGTSATPAVSNGLMILRTESKLTCIAAR
jgi:outer membrane protein assembly factor BamB